MRSVFITGTDTGIGKTAVAAALLAAARRSGVDAAPMKPVQTGCVPRGRLLIAPDLERCLAGAGLHPSAGNANRMCPYRFLPACSPHLAAAMAGESIDLRRIRTRLRELQRRCDAVIVEGAGGVLVPLNSRQTMADLMRLLGLPVVLVARAGLGTLNHSLLSLEALRARGIAVEGLVLVHAAAERGSRRIVADNRRVLARLGRTRILAEFPHRPAAFALPTMAAKAFAGPAERLLAALD
jgi:dethiobiotin synthase